MSVNCAVLGFSIEEINCVASGRHRLCRECHPKADRKELDDRALSTKWFAGSEKAVKALAEALGVSRSSLRNLRKQGCPWVSLFGKAYYHGQLFMEWALKNRLRASDPSQEE